MEQDTCAGQADSSVAVESTTTPTGNDRLPPDGETPVRAGVEGTWLVITDSFDMDYHVYSFSTYRLAYEFWWLEGGYLCKNHTPA